MPKSAATGRTLDEITEGAPAHHNGKRKSVWHSNRTKRTAASSISERRLERPERAAGSSGPCSQARVLVRQWARDVQKRSRDLAKLTGAKRRPLPKKPQAELATLVPEPPKGNEWLHEIKFDGYRMLCRVEEGSSPVFEPQRPGLDGPLRRAGSGGRRAAGRAGDSRRRSRGPRRARREPVPASAKRHEHAEKRARRDRLLCVRPDLPRRLRPVRRAARDAEIAAPSPFGRGATLVADSPQRTRRRERATSSAIRRATRSLRESSPSGGTASIIPDAAPIGSSANAARPGNS